LRFGSDVAGHWPDHLPGKGLKTWDSDLDGQGESIGSTGLAFDLLDACLHTFHMLRVFH